MSTAKLRVHGTELRRLLRLPLDTQVQPVEVTVSHPDIPEGAREVEPLFRSHHTGPRAFLHWNPKN